MKVADAIVVVQMDIAETVFNTRKYLGGVFVGHLRVTDVEQEIQVGVSGVADEVEGRGDRGEGGSREMFDTDFDTEGQRVIGDIGQVSRVSFESLIVDLTIRYDV